MRMYMTASPYGGSFRLCGVPVRCEYGVTLSLAALCDRSKSCTAYSTVKIRVECVKGCLTRWCSWHARTFLCFAHMSTCYACDQELTQHDGETRMRAVPLKPSRNKEKTSAPVSNQKLTTRRRQNPRLNLAALQLGHGSSTLSEET